MRRSCDEAFICRHQSASSLSECHPLANKPRFIDNGGAHLSNEDHWSSVHDIPAVQAANLVKLKAASSPLRGIVLNEFHTRFHILKPSLSCIPWLTVYT